MPILAALAVSGPVLTVPPITLIPRFVALACGMIGVGIGAVGMHFLTDIINGPLRRTAATIPPSAQRPTMSLAHSVFRDLSRTASAIDFWHLEHLVVCLRADPEITGTILERVRDERRQLGHDKMPRLDD